MFGLKELKERIMIERDVVVCPVRGCENRVKKMTRDVVSALDGYLKDGQERTEVFEPYLCKDHKIYITPSTFIYEDFKDNLLWRDVDEEMFNKILEVKRVKAQLHHDNSEDAVTWNVFRFLEERKLLGSFLGKLSNSQIKNLEITYWSYSQSQQGSWSELENARREFNEDPNRSSEPDLIIKCDEALFSIEAKLASSTKTDFRRGHKQKGREERIRRYSKGDCFLNQPVGNLIDAGYYQLMRSWLIGSLIAEKLKLNFYLINLVLSDKVEDTEEGFNKYVRCGQDRKFMIITWEDVFQHILNNRVDSEDWGMMVTYFKNKSLGYKDGKLQRAFLV